MAKLIKVTPDILEEAVRSFSEALKTMRLTEGKISFQKTVAGSERKATVIFSELSWLKMSTLVREYESEIAWHGTARRGEDDIYYVDDIVVYPQTVTGSTVTPDQVLYQNWLMEQPDEIFNSIRFQGHSHVNMGVTPSTVDTAWYEEILSQLDDTMFYIFMIVNKKGDRYVSIYDMAKNLWFGSADVAVKIRDDGLGIEGFLKDAENKVTRVTYTPPATTYPTYSGQHSGTTTANKKNVKDYEPETKPKKQEKKKPFGVAHRDDGDGDDYYDQLKYLYGMYD